MTAKSIFSNGMVVALALGMGSMPSTAFGFAEELFSFPRHSSIHYDTVYALAICAGYSSTQATTVATFSQLPDSGNFGGETLCQGTLPTSPDYATSIVGSGFNEVELRSGGCDDVTNHRIFPLRLPTIGSDCTAGRFNGFNHFFHFPEEADLTILRDWAFTGSALEADYIAGYGGLAILVESWECLAVSPGLTPVLGGGLDAGDSLETLGVYLHALGDHASHNDCLDDMVGSTAPMQYPWHKGRWGSDTCAFAHHVDEVTDETTSLGEYPLYRTVEAAVGYDAMSAMYGAALPYSSSKYGFTGIYEELVAWRDAHPALFSATDPAIPIDTANVDYQDMVLLTHDAFFDNGGFAGFLNFSGRKTDLDSLLDYCAAY